MVNFVRNAVLEKVEDAHDLLELGDALNADTGDRFSIDEILNELR